MYNLNKYSFNYLIVFFIALSIILLNCTSDKTPSNTLSKLADSINKSHFRDAPNSALRFVNAIALSNSALEFNYTILRVKAGNFNSELFQREQKPFLIQQILSEPALLNFYRKENVTIIYSYKDINGNFLTEIKITPNDYL